MIEQFDGGGGWWNEESKKRIRLGEGGLTGVLL